MQIGKRLNLKGRLTSNRRRMLLVAIIGIISLLWFIIGVSLLHIERANTTRFQSENYERFRQNLNDFDDVLEATDSFCQEIDLSKDAFPYIVSADWETLNSELMQPGVTLVEEDLLFVKDSLPHKMTWHLRSIVVLNRDFSDVALYNPRTEVSIVVASDGQFAALESSRAELTQMLGVSEGFENAQDGALVGAEPTQYAQSQLYAVRHVGEMILLCGMEEKTLDRTLFADNAGRSYSLEQMLLDLPDGTRLYKDKEKTSDIFAMVDDPNAEQDYWRRDGYTLMRHRADGARYVLTVVLSETGATSVLSSTWFYLLLIINVLWLLLLTAIGIDMLVHIFRPLKKISVKIDDTQMQTKTENSKAADDIDRISMALNRYHTQFDSDQLTIKAQADALSEIYLRQLALEHEPTMPLEQLEKLGITQILKQYILMVIYPDDVNWTQNSVSEQESNYRLHVNMAVVQELLKERAPELQMQFLDIHQSLLVIVPILENDLEGNVRQKLERSVMGMGMQFGTRLCFGMSKVKSGYENFRGAYQEAMRSAALIEECESGRSDDISLNTLMKQNMHMADLVYMERYSEAFVCFKEMVSTLFGQKSRYLRNRQLTSILSLTFCMLTETNENNLMLLDQMNVNVDDLLKPADEDDLLAKWEAVFTKLGESKDSKLLGQYSEQFAPIYQYMYTHFRNQDLSLSMLAEKFGMSTPTLSREFQKNLGTGFLESLHQIRIEAARYEIEHTNTPLNDIAAMVGYTNALTMTRAFKKYLGNTPGHYRKKKTSQ